MNGVLLATVQTIGVLIVDDSTVAQVLLTEILESDPQIRVIGTAGDGQAAIDFVNQRRPDVILMDIHMPRMDGFEATRRIMETQPVPIVACSATTKTEEATTAFRVLEAGALACIEKPPGREHANFEQLAHNIRQTVKVMSEVKVVRRWAKARLAPSPGSQPRPGQARTFDGIQVVGIGASTGGPQVLQQILAALPRAFSAPILIVQHIAYGFLPGLCDWLNQTTGFRTQIGAYGVAPLPGHVYLAPDDFHMGMNGNGRIVLTKEEPENHLRPAVSYLFRSLAEVYGPAAVGVLLTGMGKDGAVELKLMKERGAVTIAQDAETSVVHGMPGEAIKLGAVTHVLQADRIAEVLVSLVNRRLGERQRI